MESVEVNSRTSHRMSPTHDTAVIHGLTPSPIPAAVVDESFGGIGIAIPVKLADDAQQQDWEDLELTVEYAGVACTAVIRHVESMQSGCRIGLEWKAQALSRCLRDLLRLLPNVSQELSQILPGGFSMMWKMYEAGRWGIILESAERLSRQISRSENPLLVESIVRFKDIMQHVCESEEQASLKERVQTALDTLIRDCIQALSN